ncbi:hypothetical protein ACX9NE_28645 [Mycobacterium sp. ML4]
MSPAAKNLRALAKVARRRFPARGAAGAGGGAAAIAVRASGPVPRPTAG